MDVWKQDISSKASTNMLQVDLDWNQLDNVLFCNIQTLTVFYFALSKHPVLVLYENLNPWPSGFHPQECTIQTKFQQQCTLGCHPKGPCFDSWQGTKRVSRQLQLCTRVIIACNIICMDQQSSISILKPTKTAPV